MKLQILGPGCAKCMNTPTSRSGNCVVQNDSTVEFHPMAKLLQQGKMSDYARANRAAASENESEIMKTKPECYGTMFPDFSKLEFNTPNEGKAFTVLVESGMGISNRQSSVRMEGWDACTECAEYDRCYDLSMAKLLLHQTIQGYGMARAF